MLFLNSPVKYLGFVFFCGSRSAKLINYHSYSGWNIFFRHTCWILCSSAGFRQPRPAWQGLHLLASVVHRPGYRQRGGVVREALDLWGDRPDWAHPTGWAHLPHRLPGVRLPQTAQRLRGGQPRSPPETPSCAAQQVIWMGSFLVISVIRVFYKRCALDTQGECVLWS